MTLRTCVEPAKGKKINVSLLIVTLRPSVDVAFGGTLLLEYLWLMENRLIET